MKKSSQLAELKSAIKDMSADGLREKWEREDGPVIKKLRKRYGRMLKRLAQN